MKNVLLVFVALALFCTPLLLAQETANCIDAGGAGGVNCTNTSLCCGAGTMEPSCLPTDNSTHCCNWYLAATQCKQNEACCGSEGYGASSSAWCCTAGEVCCAKSGDGTNTCCKPTDVCCALASSYSWCCPQNSTCGNGITTKCSS